MHRASDRVEQAEWLERLNEAAESLGLDPTTTTTAADLYLSAVPDDDRSKPPQLAASLYAASLIDGDGRTQTAVAEAVGVSRLVVQDRWKAVLRSAGFQPPDW